MSRPAQAGRNHQKFIFNLSEGFFFFFDLIVNKAKQLPMIFQGNTFSASTTWLIEILNKATCTITYLIMPHS